MTRTGRPPSPQPIQMAWKRSRFQVRSHGEPKLRPSWNPGRSLGGTGHRQGEPRGAEVSPIETQPQGVLQGKLEAQAVCLALSPPLLKKTRLGGSAFLPSTTQTHSDISPHLLFKKNLMFSIIHPSQKIIDRARNENLSHIL